MTDQPTTPAEETEGMLPARDCSASEEYRHPQAWQDALDALYVQYATEPTPAQRIKILESALGLNAPGVSYCIESTADWRIPKEEIELRNMRCLELDYLEQIGLHKPQYC